MRIASTGELAESRRRRRLQRTILQLPQEGRAVGLAHVAGAFVEPGAAGRVAVACEIDDTRLVTVMLTPHHDRAHHNYLHLEIANGVTWRLVW